MFILISIKNKKEYVEIVDSMNIRKTDRSALLLSVFLYQKLIYVDFELLLQISDYCYSFELSY